MSTGYRVEHRVSRTTKQKPEWYKPLAEYMIGKIDSSILEDIKDKINAVRGDISDTYYKKVLNPFNASDKKFTRWRGEMRNFDIMRDIIRRYLGEYSRQPFDFQVKANDPEVITRFSDALNAKITNLAIQAYVNSLNAAGVDTGQPTKEVPDFEKFYQEFKIEYVDDLAAQGQALLTAIIDWTDSNLKYYKSFYDYIVLGQTFTYRDIRGNVLHKEVIDPLSYHPISNGEPFIEDHDNGIRTFKVTMSQLLENFSTILTEETYNKVRKLYDSYRTSSGGVAVPLSYFKSLMDDATYTAFTSNTRNTARIGNDMYRLTNKDDMVDGYHFVFTTEVKVGHLIYLDPVTGTLTEELIEADTFKFNQNEGHISITWEWWNEYWEFYQFGDTHDDIYSIPRPIAFQRRDNNNPQKIKSPYNGLCEIVPGTGFTFSIPDAVLPYQIARNIFAFYREKIIAKNKDKIVVIPKSLLGDETFAENAIYRMEANSVFAYDDSEDDAGTKAQHIRILDASLSQFISHITDLMDRMKQEAWETVDMNAQRYGDIATSAGKATTEEAIVRSSMGSVIIFTMFERFLEREFTADLEYSKMAYIKGKKGSYSDVEGNTRFLDLDVDNHLLANYGIHVVSAISQTEKKRAMRDLAFNASQNGNVGLAAKAVLSDNVASIKKAFTEFEKAQTEYQRSIANEKEQIMAQVEQAKAQNEEASRQHEVNLANIREAGETQRTVMELQVKLLDLQTQLESTPENTSNSDAINDQIALQKLELDKVKQSLDMQKHRDTIGIKREEMASKEKIAKMNKNKHDTKK
jgi:hypothetical protein